MEDVSHTYHILFLVRQHVMKFAEMTQEVQVARPELRRLDTGGLAPGRRRLAEQYRQARLDAQENGLDDVMLPEALLYSLGPPFPSLEVRVARTSCTC